MRELSLFTGGGGGVLASKYLLGWRAIGYVENNFYCQKTIRRRIADGLLDSAPIFGDINAFVRRGGVDVYSGMADIVTGGFPCTPFSSAGRRRGKDDPNNQWPNTFEVVKRVRPRFGFFENVRRLLASRGYFKEILSDLSAIGYDSRWCVLSGGQFGCPHFRERVWLLAYDPRQSVRSAVDRMARGREQTAESRRIYPRNLWWKSEAVPRVDRVVNGMAYPMDYAPRLEALGNGQIPIVAAIAWTILSRDLEYGGK